MEIVDCDESGESLNSTLSSSPPSHPVLPLPDSNGAEDAEEHSSDKYESPVPSPCHVPEKQIKVFLDRFGLYAIRVRNLGGVINDHDLAELFSDIGRVHTVKMHCTKRGLPIAFVKFRTEDEAKMGIKKYDGYVFKGLKLECSPAYDKQGPAWLKKYPDSVERRGHVGMKTDRDVRQASPNHTSERKVRPPEPQNSSAQQSNHNGLLAKGREMNGFDHSENGHPVSLHKDMENLHIEVDQHGNYKPLNQWTVQDVVEYFRGTESKEFADFFGIEQIDGCALQLLDRATLCEHMKLGPALKITNIINKLKIGNF